VEINPVLKKLGFAGDDRVAIIHTDDIGMCQASVDAFADLWDVGLISSGATMVPCPWFPEAAAFCRAHPEVDMGVHLTLTSEWKTYRWGPISTRDPASGLIDDEGFFYRTSEEAQQHGDPAAIQRELEAQVARALAYGVPITHVDTHMGTVAVPQLIPGYLQLAAQHGVPPMMFRLDESGWMAMGMDAGTAQIGVQMVGFLEEQGVPLLDAIGGLELDRAKTPEERIAYAKESLDALKPGITHFIIHPTRDTPEVRAITPDWPCRVADYEAFRSEALRRHVRDSGVHVIGYRALKDLIGPVS
jgi:predicted glycoside hydrolase/deacetylase ChbG (UPF0249 family)